MTPEQEADWLAWRAGGIGSSDIAAMASGLYGGMYSVVATKLGYAAGRDIDPAVAARGHRWEQPVADAVRALTGYYVHGEQLCVEAPANPRHRATLDGALATTPTIDGLDQAAATLEIKTHPAQAPTSDKIRTYRTAQVLWALHCTGLPQGWLVVARIDDADDSIAGLSIETVERDDFQIGLLVELADEALRWVDAGELPPPDDATDIQLVKEIHQLMVPPADRDILDATAVEDDIARWLQITEAQRPLANERKTIEARFREFVGDNMLAENDRYRLRIGESVAKFTDDSAAEALAEFPEYGLTVLDRARFKADHPDIYEALKRPTTDRRITVKEFDR